MPRSLSNPNISTYHEALNLLLSGTHPNLPITKGGGKYTQASLAYLCGYFGLEYGKSVQDIFAQVSLQYNLPDEFIRWVRVIQQNEKGVNAPGYDLQECVSGVMAYIPEQINQGLEGEVEYEFDFDGTELSDAPVEVSEVDKTYEEMAAENPYAARFVEAILASCPPPKTNRETPPLSSDEVDILTGLRGLGAFDSTPPRLSELADLLKPSGFFTHDVDDAIERLVGKGLVQVEYGVYDPLISIPEGWAWISDCLPG